MALEFLAELLALRILRLAQPGHQPLLLLALLAHLAQRRLLALPARVLRLERRDLALARRILLLEIVVRLAPLEPLNPVELALEIGEACEVGLVAVPALNVRLEDLVLLGERLELPALARERQAHLLELFVRGDQILVHFDKPTDRAGRALPPEGLCASLLRLARGLGPRPARRVRGRRAAMGGAAMPTHVSPFSSRPGADGGAAQHLAERSAEREERLDDG